MEKALVAPAEIEDFDLEVLGEKEDDLVWNAMCDYSIALAELGNFYAAIIARNLDKLEFADGEVVEMVQKIVRQKQAQAALTAAINAEYGVDIEEAIRNGEL